MAVLEMAAQGEMAARAVVALMAQGQPPEVLEELVIPQAHLLRRVTMAA